MFHLFLLTCGMKRTALLLFIISVISVRLMAGGVDFNRLVELNRQGRFELVVEEASRLIRDNTEISLPETLRLNRYLAGGYLGCRRYKESLNALNSIIEFQKPDSLLYYNLNAYIGMNDIFLAIGSTELAGTAISKAEETLEIVERYCDRSDYKKTLYSSAHGEICFCTVQRRFADGIQGVAHVGKILFRNHSVKDCMARARRFFVSGQR